MSYYERNTSSNNRSRYRLYVGNISHRCHPSDVEELFGDYGELTDFDFKDRGQQVNFCFVEYRSSRDSEDAMYELNGHRLLGVPIIVEPARERRPRRTFFSTNAAIEGYEYSPRASGSAAYLKNRSLERRGSSGHRYIISGRGRYDSRSPPLVFRERLPRTHAHHTRSRHARRPRPRSRSRSRSREYQRRVVRDSRERERRYEYQRRDGIEEEHDLRRREQGSDDEYRRRRSESDGDRHFSRSADAVNDVSQVHEERLALVPDIIDMGTDEVEKIENEIEIHADTIEIARVEH